ncbi:MAG: S8/S53 family peptidase [Verrucomicrobia bacterium]|nr:S8/S53 family peptidase [Verrucomicrobiota bacterium]
MKDSDGLPLPGSELQVPPTAELIGPCPADTQIEVTVYLRSKDPSGLQEYVEQTSVPGNHVYLTPQQFAHKFGADPADVEAVKNFAEAKQLSVLGHNLGRRSVTLSGTAARLNEAFGVNLQHYRYAGGVYRLRQGSIRIPASFENIITGIFGFDNRPKARAHFRILSKKAAAPGAVTPETYTPLQLAAIYDFPGGFTGQGETIGIIELGGGYNQTDLDNYFQQLGVSPAPSVTAVSVDGATNSPTGDPNGADGEVELDIEVTGSIAPGAAIKVFFAPNTDQGFIDAVTTAVNDSAVTLISISWGGPESTFTAQSMTTFNQAFQDAGTMGKTVFVAAGDSGSSDGESDGANHVDFPASSPFVVGCGGTTLVANTSTDTITSEVVWNETASNEGATGGGVSDFFAKPSYQDSVNVPAPTTQAGGRGVPDVAGDADPVTGYQVIIDGSTTTIGGTSAVAPLYAGLFARINQALVQKGKSRVGSVNAALYQNPSAFHDIVSGNNGAFSAGPGWDPTTGLGSPDGGSILSAVGG